MGTLVPGMYSSLSSIPTYFPNFTKIGLEIIEIEDLKGLVGYSVYRLIHVAR
jgi:hypothetical protein